jgi:hypothetical protein
MLTRGTVAWLCLLILLWQAALAEERVCYATPPRCLVWMEGEDCPDHNWTEGPTDNCWAFGWAGVHGGVLDLAHWRLPAPDQPYYARLRTGCPAPENSATGPSSCGGLRAGQHD